MSKRDEAQAEVERMRRRIRRLVNVNREPTLSEVFLPMFRGLVRRLPSLHEPSDAREADTSGESRP